MDKTHRYYCLFPSYVNASMWYFSLVRSHRIHAVFGLTRSFGSLRTSQARGPSRQSYARGLQIFRNDSRVHHGEVGGLIAQHWKLPDSIVEGITHHHTPSSGESIIPFATHLGNAVANVIGGYIAWDALESHGLPETWDRLDMRPEDFRELCDEVGDRFEALREQYQ